MDAPDAHQPADEPPRRPAPALSSELRPLPYHRDVVRHLKRHAKAVWAHYASEERDSEIAEAQRLHLLKTTVVLKRESHPDLYAIVDEVASAIGLGVPVELYQGADSGNLNGALLYLPSAARVILHGPVQERLSRDELRAFFGHELAHHRLWSMEEGTFLTAWHALLGVDGMAALDSVANTLRLYSLATEVFADRVSLDVAGLDASVGCLVKVRTGLSQVAPQDFLEQSRELFAAEGTGSREWTHPEAHIRALALAWYDDGSTASDGDIRRLLEGPMQLDELDLVRREALAGLTERMIDVLLQPRWFRTETVIGQARLMIDDYTVPDDAELSPEDGDLAGWGDSVRDYLAYVLTDFVSVDPDLDDLPFLRAHVVAERLGIEARLERAVNRELRKTKKSIREALAERDARLTSAEDAS